MAKKKVKEVKQPKKSDIDIDFVCEMLIEGKTYKQIADMLKITEPKLFYHTTKVEFSARVRDALQISSNTYANKAENVLNAIPKQATQGDIVKARELAQHYRWMAGKRNPKQYGDKLDVTSDNKALSNGISITTWVQDNINASTSKR